MLVTVARDGYRVKNKLQAPNPVRVQSSRTRGHVYPSSEVTDATQDLGMTDLSVTRKNNRLRREEETEAQRRIATKWREELSSLEYTIPWGHNSHSSQPEKAFGCRVNHRLFLPRAEADSTSQKSR